MKKIAAICATPRLLNTGMLCVDESLFLLLDNLDLVKSTSFYCFDRPDYLRSYDSSISYQHISNLGALADYDLIILWGDFIITRDWINTICDLLSKELQLPFDEVRSSVEQKVLLKNQSNDCFKRTIVFGQSLMVDGREIFDEKEYIEPLRKLISKARLARFRDPISAYRAGIISGKPVGNFTGMDAALLLQTLRAVKGMQPERRRDTKRIGVFFGRTKNARVTKLQIGRTLRKQYPDYEFVWIPWLRERAVPGIKIQRIYKLDLKLSPQSLGEYLELLHTVDFVVTDIYHMTLMSWSHGIPAVCLGNGTELFTQTLGDKKKEFFYSSNYLSDLYIFNETCAEAFKKKQLGDVFKRAEQKGLGEQVKANIARLAKENIDSLEAAILACLNNGSGNILS